ncbi:MAG: hypothetical protein OEU26_10370, partial [Candidatus Tectomicrobia bacterium]|nr:hypothetical protein [Candidatus Tectomicrobia bacterium]
MIRQFAKHHNKIQFFGYEVANVVLVVQQALQRGTTGYGLNYETFSALSLLAGSAFIWRFDPERRPHLLLYGGIALTIGGLFLMAAGYIMTGLAVAVASLETARGGLLALQDYIDERSKKGASVESFLDHTLQIARLALGWYLMPIDYLTSKFQHFGRFINDRPFITGTLIKAPMRLEFIVKKMLIGDWIGAAVGISWMTLGDVALAFNDAKLQAFVEQRDAAPSYILIGANQTGKTSLLRSAAASVAPTIQPISDASDPTRDCDWWMFPTATILDTTGRYAFPVQGQDDGEPWQRLLARLRRWRNRRPIQGLLVAVAADTLASQEPDALRHDAMELRQRIHEAKQALKVDLPVYLILTRCDVIEGFTEFFEAMPKPSLQQAFGATQAVQQGDHNSSIVEPSVTAVLDPLVDRLRKLRLHLLTTGKASSAALRRAIFCFPEEFRALQPSIRLFVETLFTPSPHLSALSFRGLFLSSACQQGTPVSLLRYRFRTSLPSQRATEDRQPYFLHDLFTTILPRDQANASDTRRPSILRTRAVLAPVAGLAIGWLLFKYSINENPFILIAIFLAGLVSGFLGAIAGSGGLVAVPALMALGLPAQVAIATNRLGALGQWLGAIG